MIKAVAEKALDLRPTVASGRQRDIVQYDQLWLFAGWSLIKIWRRNAARAV